ncbi:MAG: flagellar hook-length control protein FliK [Caulobacterales bacterium]|uniref:flagellar hook-length control protein FliK n=1 Tax=Glycocaulis sp. TaxID=1969725 RepID=UPI003FA06567
MLPGSAISDPLFSAPANRGAAGAQPAAAANDGAGDFDALLAGASANASANPSGKSPQRTQSGTTRAPEPETGKALPDTTAIPATGETAEPLAEPQPDAQSSATGEKVSAPVEGEEAPEAANDSDPQPEAQADRPVTDDTSPVAEAGAQGEDTGSAAATGMPAISGQPSGETVKSDQTAQPASPPAQDMATSPAASAEPGTEPATPAKPASDAKATPQAGATQPPSPQPAPVQPASPQPAAQPAATPAGPADANAEMTGNPQAADGEEPGLAAFRRELERGETRGETSAKDSAAAAKAGLNAKEGRATSGAPAAQAPNAAATNTPTLPSPAQTLPQTLLQSQQAVAGGNPVQDIATGGMESEGGDIRLESGSSLPGRSESAAAQASRAANLPPHLRMTPGHAADLGQMIARRFADGGRSFDIRLDPPELGQVRIRLEIGADRSVQAMLTAEKPEALAELQRNARELERALAEAGLDLGENGIGFSLNENSADDREFTAGQSGENDPSSGTAETLNITNAAPAITSRYGFALAGRTSLDLRI